MDLQTFHLYYCRAHFRQAAQACAVAYPLIVEEVDACNDCVFTRAFKRQQQSIKRNNVLSELVIRS
jgi:hypothetical protein